MSAAEHRPEAAQPVRERLLDAAEQVVARDGVSNLTLEAVAREAAVSKGGLLYHFPTKSALVEGVVKRLASYWDAKLSEALAADPAGPGAFTRAVISVGGAPTGCQHQPVHTALLAAAGTDPQYLAPMRECSAKWQARLESDGIDPAVAMTVRLAIDGLNLCTLLGLPVPTGELRERVIEMLRKLTALAPTREMETS